MQYLRKKYNVYNFLRKTQRKYECNVKLTEMVVNY